MSVPLPAPASTLVDVAAKRQQRLLALLVAGCYFMENLDGTILTTAAPSIGRDFGIDPATVGVSITAYVMTLAILIPVSGWLADRFGSRRILLVAIAVFVAGSVLSGLSQNLGELVAARVVQGIGGSMMVPVGRMTVLRVTPRRDVIRAIAILTWPALAAPVVAPLAGGLITTYASWHWIFFINIPLGAIGFVAGMRILPRHVASDTVARIPDWAGLALTSAGLAAFVFGTSLLTRDRIDVAAVIVSLALGAVLLGLAIVYLLRARRPFVDLRLLGVTTYRAALGGGGSYRLLINAVPFALPLLFQDAFGWTPVQAGSAVLLLFLGNLGVKPATTWMLHTFGFRRLLVGAHLVGAVCLLAVATFAVSTPIVVLVVVLIASGMVRSVGFTAYNSITYADIDQTNMSHANVLDSTVQQVAIGTGVALGAIAIAAGTALGRVPGVVATVGLHGGGQFPYEFTFVALAVLLVVATIPAWRLSANAGSGLMRG